MARVDPPFRADHVGSLLRSPDVLDARTKAAAGAITADELRAVEDAAIARNVAARESIGMHSITDGEQRRAWFHLDFLQQLEGVAVTGSIASSSDSAATVHMTPPKLSVVGPLRHVRTSRWTTSATSRPSRRRHRRYRSRHRRWSTSARARGHRPAGVPGPRPVLRRPRRLLPGRDRRAVRRRLRYLQLDDTNLAYLCDPAMRAGAVERGDDPDELPRVRRADQPGLASRPADLTVAIHLCRGNYRSTWFASGGYEPVAEVLFNDLDVDATSWSSTTSGQATSLPFASCPTTRWSCSGW